jgi:carboxypeptidase family protein
MSTPVTTNSFAPLATSSVKVTISGTNISTNVDGNGQFTLTGVPPGDVTMQFSGPGISASITLKGVTADQQITIDVTLNGTSARLDSDTRRDNDRREIEGHITAINAGARTITVAGSVIAVPVDARIHRGTAAMTFADLKVGVEVEVQTTMNGTTLTATDVKIDVDGGDGGRDAVTD